MYINPTALSTRLAAIQATQAKVGKAAETIAGGFPDPASIEVAAAADAGIATAGLMNRPDVITSALVTMQIAQRTLSLELRTERAQAEAMQAVLNMKE